MPFLDAAGLAVHYDLTGPEGAPVVLLAHSLGTSLHVWDPQAAALAQRFRVLRYDLRGHGLSDLPPASDAGDGIDRLAGDALALLDGLSIDRVRVCGLSVGGMIAQRLAARVPARVAALVLCDTAMRIGPPGLWDERIAAIRRDGLAGIAEGVLARWFTARFLAAEPATARGFANMLTRTPAEGYLAAVRAIRDADLEADCRGIACPTLVVVGDGDAATPPEAARALAAAIRGARLEVVPQAAHIPTVEQPAALNRLLLDFLDAAESGAA